MVPFVLDKTELLGTLRVVTLRIPPVMLTGPEAFRDEALSTPPERLRAEPVLFHTLI